MNKKNKQRKSNEPKVIELNLSLTVITIVAICTLIGIITGVKIITTMIAAKESDTLVATESDTVIWVDSSEIGEDGNPIKVPVPKGYTASQIDGETTVSGGFVIYQGDIDWNQIIIKPTAATAGDGTSSNSEEQQEDNTREEEEDDKTEINRDESLVEDVTDEKIDESLVEDKTDEKVEDTEIEENVSVDNEIEDEKKDSEKEKIVPDNEEENTGFEQEEKLEDSTDVAQGGGSSEKNDAKEEENLEQEENVSKEDSKEDGDSEIEKTSSDNDLIETTEKTAPTGDISSNVISMAGESSAELTVEEQQTMVNIFQLQSTVNQWVWVPVNDISKIYGVDINGRLWGKLYDFPTTNTGTRIPYSNSWSEVDGVMNIASITTYQEPNVLSNLNGYDIDMNLQSYLDGKTRYEFLKELESMFYATIKSIKQYGGFYIGRYETGGLSSMAVVQKMNTDISNKTWYVMYDKCKDLNGINDNVFTSMILGSLWDETLEWLVQSGATNMNGEKITYTAVGTNSVGWGNYYDSEFDYIIPDGNVFTTQIKTGMSNIKIPTGSADYTKINNIYDMAGNIGDRTIESNGSSNRIYRGESYEIVSGCASRRSSTNPVVSYNDKGCRAMLILK